jgi:HEPN domain-containing protein
VTGTYKVGVGGSGGIYMDYLLSKAQEPGQKVDALARYYAGREAEMAPRVVELGRQVHVGDLHRDDAITQLLHSRVADGLPAGQDTEAVQAQISKDLDTATAMAAFRASGTAMAAGARIRPDIDPELARRLEIDMSRPLSVRELAHLMDNRTAAGNEIAGKKKHSEHRSVADIFGLDREAAPTVEQVRNVLAGRRADGGVVTAATKPREDPQEEQEKPKQAKPLSTERVNSAIRKFQRSLGLPMDREATDADIERAVQKNDLHDYRKGINATAPPVAYIDMVWNADKSVSVAFALAPTDAEADLIRSMVRNANGVAMTYLEGQIAVARTGAGGSGPPEAAKLAWLSVEHADARPTVDVIRHDAEGNAFSEPRDVPGGRYDPHLHVHNPVLSSMLTASGRISSVNIGLLDGEVKVFGAVGHAAFATEARQYGIDVTLGPNGEARIAAVPDWLRQFMSRRTTEGTKAAEAFVRKYFDKEWGALSNEQRIALLDKGVAATRRDKDLPEPGGGDIKTERARWQEEAERAGYKHRSVLRPDEIAAELTPDQRIKVAREAALPLLDKELQANAVISAAKLREIATRGLIVSGIGRDDPAADIAAVVGAFRNHGVTLRGEKTNLIEFMTHGKDGRIERNVTTGKNVELEESVVAAVRAAAADRSTALTAGQIDAAAERFLARHPKIDREGAHWKAQLAMAHRIGEGGRVSLSIGVAGSGKTSAVVATLVDAWHAQGKTVYGMTVPWRSTDALRDAGVDQAVAIEAFLRRVAKGRITLDANSVIVADEVSQIGIRHQAALLTLSAQTGCRLAEIGDPKQCQAVDSPAINLMAATIGDENIPKLLSTIRQRTERGREVTTMFRDGRAAEGIAALTEDGKFHLVAGGTEATIKHTAHLWRTLTDANATNPDYSLLVMTPTNAQALEVGKAIRELRRDAGEIGETDIVRRAMDPNSGEQFDLPIASGDRLRLFLRTFDADTPQRGKLLGSNGTVVDVLEVQPDGLRVRNAEGTEGRVTWEAMRPWRAPKTDPIRVTMGMAVTIDSAQSMTKTAAILSMPGGSGQVSGNKAYTGLSRQEEDVHLVTSDSAERKAIVARQRHGLYEVPNREDVVRNIAGNLSRFAEKRQVTDMLAHAVEVRRNVLGSRHRGIEAAERSEPQSGITDYRMDKATEVARRVMETADRVMRTVRDQAQDLLARTLAEARSHTPRRESTRQHSRGPRPGH